MHTVYVLQSLCNPDRHYVGATDELARRLTEHSAGKCPHTAKFMPWRVLVSVNFDVPEKAQTFERYLKSGSGRAFAKKHF